MPQLQPKQIAKLIAGVIKITGFTVTASTSSTVITSQLATALSTAGNGGGSVALIQSTNNTSPGVPTSSPGNKSEIWNSTTKEKMATAAGYEIYGRLTFAASIWTLSYYYLDGTGTEQSYTLLNTDPTLIDVDFIYRFQFVDFPTDGLVSIITRNVYFDPVGSGAAAIVEQLTVTATNVLSNISVAPGFPTKTILFVNGKAEAAVAVPAPFTLAGNVVTWSSSNAGYILETTDNVVVEYYV
jgi:hypothetical protein